MARFNCLQCHAWYDSERELQDHMRATPPEFRPDNSKIQPNDVSQNRRVQQGILQPRDWSW
jgi:hypothetical protein